MVWKRKENFYQEICINKVKNPILLSGIFVFRRVYKMKKIETNFKRNLFWKVSNIKFNGKLGNTEKGLINLYPDMNFQEIIGFGGALTEATGYCLKQVNEAIENQILEDCFSENGLDYSFCRTPIGSCDFSLSSYSYLDNKDKKFSIERDERYIIPMIKNVLKRKPNLKLLASPWSPPAFMKNNKMRVLGGKLLEKNDSLYAEYLVKYILEYQKRGIPIQYMTVQNEPNAVQIWESCLYSAKEEADFVENYLYPKLIENGIQTKILAWDHNKERLFSRAKDIYKIAPNSIAGMAMHWYSGDYFEEIYLTKRQYPNKLLIHTEGCTGFSNFRKEDEVMNAEIYSHDILGDLNAGINGFIDWNVLLDHKGGPNHKRNYCNAPIMLNSDNTGYIKNLTYYYIGHFSKYVKPGARRIGFSKFTSDIEVTAFKNPDDSIAVILLNRKDKNKEFTLQLEGRTFHDNLDSHTILTFVIEKE